MCYHSNLQDEARAVIEEILKHKWIESEKVGHDIGKNKAALDWIMKYYSDWKKNWDSRIKPNHC